MCILIFEQMFHAPRTDLCSRLLGLFSEKVTINSNNRLIPLSLPYLYRYLITFLGKLSENSEVNKMNASNIAIVIAPNIIWSPEDEG